MKKISILIFGIFFCASCYAENLLNLQYGESIKSIQEKFPNFQLKEQNFYWGAHDKKYYQLSGSDIFGLVILVFINGHVVIQDNLKLMQEELKKVTGAEKIKLENLVRSCKKRLREPLADYLIIESIRWLPKDSITLSLLIQKYGKPDSEGISQTFARYLVWDQGIRAYLSKDKENEKVIAVEFEIMPETKK
jgi:hypothetical protein